MATVATTLVVTKQDNTSVTLPYPQEYTPSIMDVDASTTGRNAAGTMIRDRVAVKHKFSCKWVALSQTDLTKILNAVTDASFTLTTVDAQSGTRQSYTVYVGDRNMPVYWYPSTDTTSWMYSELSMNFIEL